MARAHEPLRNPRQRRLLGARMAGVCAVGLVGQISVDMPAGFFGGVAEMTTVGAIYSAVGVLVTGALLAALRRASGVVSWLVPVALSLNVGFFVPAVASDPALAAPIVIWNLLLLLQYYYPAATDAGPSRPPPASEPLARWLHGWGPAVRHLAGVATVLDVAVVGYRLATGPVGFGVCLVLGAATVVLATPLVLDLWRRRSRAVYLLVLPVAASLFFVAKPVGMLTLLAVFQVLLLATLLAQQPLALELLRHFWDHPSRLVVVSFLLLILVGTLLLTFPGAAAKGQKIQPLDALFTATSASCVTGLIVLDTPHDFSPMGHVLILALIQTGGLGIMILSTFAALLLGGGLGLRGEKALNEMLETQAAPTAYRLTRFIVLSTLTVEGLGALVLGGFFAGQGLPAGEALWEGLFHSVSAFCNAGFALHSDSLALFRREPLALLVFSLLILLGGFGFVVLAGVGRRLVARKSSRRLDVQVRVVLWTSAVLVVLGAVFYGVLEWDRSLAGLGVVDKLANAVFQSVTLRTAGFNSVDFAHLAPASALVMAVLMFIGASPGGTGGGIKTTTAAVLLAVLRSTVAGDGPPRLFDREIPAEIVARSLAIVVLSGLWVASGLFLMLIFESGGALELGFEMVSAFATVGLSLGVTPALGPVGKLLVIVTMFVGRVGPVTLVLLLASGGRRTPVVRYPKTRMMVG